MYEMKMITRNVQEEFTVIQKATFLSVDGDPIQYMQS